MRTTTQLKRKVAKSQGRQGLLLSSLRLSALASLRWQYIMHISYCKSLPSPQRSF